MGYETKRRKVAIAFNSRVMQGLCTQAGLKNILEKYALSSKLRRLALVSMWSLHLFILLKFSFAFRLFVVSDRFQDI